MELNLFSIVVARLATANLTIGPTALKFLNSAKLGKQYKSDLFLGDIKNGNLYHFKINNQRSELVLDRHRIAVINKN
jgi:hypothetical protein